MGKALAEWMTGGHAEEDVTAYRAWRFGRVYRDPVVAEETAREVYKYYYRLRYPLDTSEAGRGRRLSPLHVRHEELGAVFGTKNGWERADYYEPGRALAPGGEDQRAFGFAPPPYLDRLREEHEAFRERVGIIDLTSFGKLEVSGPRRARPARARLRRPHRSRGRPRHLHAVPRRSAAGSSPTSPSRGSPRIASASSPGRPPSTPTAAGSSTTPPATSRSAT